MDHDIQNMRRNYEKAILDVAHTDDSPLVQFKTWFDQAVKAELPEPNAMILATASPEGQPSARTMLLKGVDDKGFVFFTNYSSRKGMDIDQNPKASLLFFWGELERQIRIEGILERLNNEENDEYFYTRPIGSQIGAMASPQSKVIESREWLEERVKQLESGGEPKRPDHWGGFRLIPHQLEFWQGRPSRLHDRIQYVLRDGNWQRHRLAP